MENNEKEMYGRFPVFHPIGSKGEIYTVKFWQENGCGPLKASCTCRAGEYGQLCKHILAALKENPEIYTAFKKSYGDLLDSYIAESEELERLKKKVNSRKHQIARFLLTD